jgi:hypothetical protein
VRLVRLLIGRADEALSGLDAAVRLAVQVDVVEGRIRVPVRQRPRDEPQELVLELVGRGHPDEHEVRLIGPGDVLEHGVVAGRPVQALLDVGLLAGDAGLEDREVRGRRGREPLRQELGEVAGEAGLTLPRRPTGDRAADGGVEEADAREVAGQLLDLDQHAGRLSIQCATLDLHLDVGQLALGEGADAVGGALGPREENLVVVHLLVVGAVEDVRVQPVLVDAEVEHTETHLLGGAERRGKGARPAGRRRRRGSGERCLAGVPGRRVELEPEGGNERGVVEQGVASVPDEVRRDAAPGEEGLEIDRGAVDGGVAPAGPLDLGDLEPASFGGLGDRLSLKDAWIECRGPVAERLTVDVEGVVGRARDAWSGTRRERVPAGAGVRRSLGQQPVPGRGGALLEELPRGRHDALGRVPLDEILAQAIRCEEERPAAGWLVPRRLVAVVHICWLGKSGSCDQDCE